MTVKTDRNSCSIALFPCGSTAFLLTLSAAAAICDVGGAVWYIGPHTELTRRQITTSEKQLTRRQ